jgi:glutamate-1-semialdehyde 2,1-aminomutase
VSLDATADVDRARLHALLERERELFERRTPASRRLFEEGRRSLLHGVPMHWMAEWASPYPLFVAGAEGATVTDADGNVYVDLCLGDTGAMVGHSPRATAEAIARQAGRGLTAMLPTEDAVWASQELARRFGVTYWQFALTATDANRFTLRLAREITGRPKILLFNWCYHGSVDETIAVLANGKVVPRPGSVGPPVHPAETSRVVEWNDVDGLERALAHEDVACVLAEPALTNIGIVLPEPGYHDRLRELTRRLGTLLAIDETHTICCGPGGYTRAYGLEPDFVTVGKTIAGGLPAAAYGFAEEVARRIDREVDVLLSDTGGIGGTLAGNALSLAAIRATLAEVLTPEAFERMIPLAERFAAGVDATVRAEGLPWHVVQLGCRAEYRFRPEPPRTGAEAAAAADPELERFMHLHALNRGILLTPFHNMALMSPSTTESDVDRHTDVFAEAVGELFGRGSRSRAPAR